MGYVDRYEADLEQVRLIFNVINCNLEVIGTLSLGTIFSLCAGILIGLKLYVKYFCKEDKSANEKTNQFWHDLWYGSGWPSGKNR